MKPIIDMFKLASDYAISREDERLFRVGAVAIRGSDQKVVRARNMPVMIDKKLMDGRTEHYPFPHKHAESSLIRKLTPGSIVFTARIRYIDGKLAMARPCKTCETLLSYAGVEYVYYTISTHEYGKMYPRSNRDDRIYQF